jgi:hypothetical protein
MRGSTAVMTDSSVRLWDLVFPASRVLLGRTRAAYVHVDNLIAFSKRDRDGRVDAYLATYLPDEVVMLFFLGGELVNAAMLTPVGRYPAAIGDALRHIRSDPERSETCFHQAPREQLADMWATFAQPPLDLGLSAAQVDGAFRHLMETRWTGLLELISNGRVNYLAVQDGRFAGGRFADVRPDEAPNATVTRLTHAKPGEARPVVSLKAYTPFAMLPTQASPAMVAMFRRYLWDVVELMEREAPGQSMRRAERAHQKTLAGGHDVLRHFGLVRGAEIADPIVEPGVLAEALAVWTRELLTEFEVSHPLTAARIVRDAAREHRYALQAVGFFERLPWRIQW